MNEKYILPGTPESRIETAIETLKKGKGIILIDDENRENEGDLIFSAEKMNVSDMALMIRHCSGIVCLLKLPKELQPEFPLTIDCIL